MPRLEAAPQNRSSAVVDCGIFESTRHRATRRGNVLTSATSANERGKFIAVANQRTSFAYATNHPLLTGRVRRPLVRVCLNHACTGVHKCVLANGNATFQSSPNHVDQFGNYWSDRVTRARTDLPSETARNGPIRADPLRARSRVRDF